MASQRNVTIFLNARNGILFQAWFRKWLLWAGRKRHWKLCCSWNGCYSQFSSALVTVVTHIHLFLDIYLPAMIRKGILKGRWDSFTKYCRRAMFSKPGVERWSLWAGRKGDGVRSYCWEWVLHIDYLSCSNDCHSYANLFLVIYLEFWFRKCLLPAMSESFSTHKWH